MIKIQYPYKDPDGNEHKNLIKFYSDCEFKLIENETESIYNTVVCLYPNKYSYDETDILIDNPSSEIEEKAHAYDIIMGVEE